MSTVPTPVGKSAAELDSRLAPRDAQAEAEAEKHRHLDRDATAPGGTTPVGASAADQVGYPGRETGNPTPPPPPEGSRQLVADETPPHQVIGNLSILARQAIANEWGTMAADPRLIASACAHYEAMRQESTRLQGEGDRRYRAGVEEGRRQALDEGASTVSSTSPRSLPESEGGTSLNPKS